MKYYSGLTIAIHGFLVLLISCISVYLFSASFVFTLLRDLIARFYNFDSLYIFLILGILLAAVGGIQVLLNKKANPGLFIFLSSVLIIPSILETTDINWGGIIGVEFNPDASIPGLTVFVLLGLIAVSQIIIRLTMEFDTSAEISSAQGIDRNEIGQVYANRLGWGLALVAVVILLAGGIYLAVDSLGAALSDSVAGASPDILLIGIALVVVLVIVVYFALISGRMPEKKKVKEHVAESTVTVEEIRDKFQD